MKTLRIGLIGAGKWMRWYHLPTIRYLADTEMVVPAVIWNRTRRKAVQVAAEFSIGGVADSVDDLLTNYDIDGVLIAVSREIAASMVSAAAAAEIPFLVEKPPATSLTEARDLSRITTVPNLIAFNRVFTPVMQRLRELLPRVRPYHMSCVFARRRRDDPMFVFETGIHALANAESLFGPGRLISSSRDPAGAGCAYWRATVEHEVSPIAPSGITVDYLFAPWSGRAVERYQLIGPETTVEVFIRQHYAPDDEERIIVSTARTAGDEGGVAGRPAGDEGAAVTVWRPSDIPELERAGYVGEHRAFYVLVRDPGLNFSGQRSFSERRFAPDIRRTVELMMLAERINGGICHEPSVLEAFRI